MVEGCAGRAEPRVIAVGHAVLERLEEILGAHVAPACLVHGDLWANNILVDPEAPGGIAVKGYIDPGVEYAGPEYEMAYLEVFRTVGPRFWEIYGREHAIDAGYPLRRTVYHFHRMLVHIWYFGDAHYHRRAESLAEELAAALGEPGS